jgi:arylsulfatase A-like enzyme
MGVEPEPQWRHANAHQISPSNKKVEVKMTNAKAKTPMKPYHARTPHFAFFILQYAVFLLTISVPPCLCGSIAAAERPNILFIMTDDHAAHAMSCYGSRINTTPHLDRVARAGMRFTNCFVTNSICTPSRATILTGKYSHKNGVSVFNRFDGSQMTFPKLLQQAGYQTAVIGKWHLFSDPTGFDYWNILPGQGLYHDPVMIEMGERKKHQGYATDVITDLSLDWIRGRDRNKPFCLLLHHKAPHREWSPDARHADLFENEDRPVPETFFDDYTGRSPAAAEATMRIGRDMTKTDLKRTPPPGLSERDRALWNYQRYIKDYLRCVASVDDNVGRVLEFLDREGLAKNTVVIYTSDQGFFLGEHGWYDKRFMYEESLRMPLLVRWPASIKPGAVNEKMVLNIDFAPTLLELAGVKPPAEMQGRSFKPLLEGQPAPDDWRTSMYYRYYHYPAHHRVQPHYGVRTERHKLIYFPLTKFWELFDLEKDPGEMRNVYADEQYADIVRRLKEELTRLRTHYGDDDSHQPPADADSPATLVWGRFEKTFTAAENASPDVALDVEFTSSAGTKFTVPGFHDGGASWKVRFMPDAAGSWKFTVRSKPAVKGLDGESGAFEVRRAGPRNENRFIKHGAIQVSKDGYYLMHADGTPFFWLGDTAWNGAVLSSDGDWDKYLADRVANRFTGVQFNVVCPWRTAPADETGEVAFKGTKNVAINPKFFQRLDRRLDALNAAGLLAMPVMMWANSRKDPGNILGDEDVIKLIRYQVARYGAHHVLWCLGGDNGYRGRDADRWKKIGREIFGGGARFPVTTHPTGMNWPWEDWRGESWLTVYGYQSGHGDDAANMKWIHSGPIAQNWRNKRPRPIINLEPPYEDHIAYQSRKPHSAYNVRRAVYWSLLAAPPAGVTYGGHGIWSWQTEPGVPRDHGGTGLARPWHEAVKLPGNAEMKHMAGLFTSLPWWQLRPANELLRDQPGKADPARFISIAATVDQETLVAYTPKGDPISFDAKARSADLQVARWFNPRTGRFTAAATKEPGRFSPPTPDEDWLLLIQY